MTHRILLREVVIDVPSERVPAVAAFWSAALLTTAHEVPDHHEFIGLPDAAALSHVGIQDVGTSSARLHVDIETDDVGAEVLRLAALGAVEVSRHRSWVVMRDPAGLEFCVTPPDSDEFELRARVVGAASPAP